jgi:hypothetical protein
MMKRAPGHEPGHEEGPTEEEGPNRVFIGQHQEGQDQRVLSQGIGEGRYPPAWGEKLAEFLSPAQNMGKGCNDRRHQCPTEDKVDGKAVQEGQGQEGSPQWPEDKLEIVPDQPSERSKFHSSLQEVEEGDRSQNCQAKGMLPHSRQPTQTRVQPSYHHQESQKEVHSRRQSEGQKEEKRGRKPQELGHGLGCLGMRPLFDLTMGGK